MDSTITGELVSSTTMTFQLPQFNMYSNANDETHQFSTESLENNVRFVRSHRAPQTMTTSMMYVIVGVIMIIIALISAGILVGAILVSE